MTDIRLRCVGDPLAYDFEVLLRGRPLTLPGATLSFAAIDPNGVSVPGVAAWLTGAQSHIVRCLLPRDATTVPGRHQLQLRIEDASLAEPVRGRVYVTIEPSAVFT